MVGQNVYNKLQGLQTQWTSICTQARRHPEPLPQTIGWGYHYLLGDGPNRFNKSGRVETMPISISSLQQESAPILSWRAIIHPTFAGKVQKVNLPKSSIKSVIAVASYTQIPRTSPNSGFLLTCSNKHSHFTTWKSSAFLFRRSFSLGWTLAVRDL